MLTTFLHFPNGTHKAIETPTSYDTCGYEPSRKDNLITAHIITQDGYELFIDNHSLTLKYKYITLNYSRYSIGKYSYPINTIDSYKGSEQKHIKRLKALRDEILNYQTVDGYKIPYRLNCIVIAFMQ